MHFIGIEISPPGTRAVVLDVDTAVVSSEAWVSHDWVEGLPTGYKEQNPAHWIDAASRAVRQCLDTLRRGKEEVSAIGIAGPVRGLVLLDEENRIIRPTKMTGDTSTKQQAEEISRTFGGAPGLIEMLGRIPGPESAAAELLWIKQYEPYHFQRIASVLTVQDFLSYWLTGEQATEQGSASATGLFDVRERGWNPQLMEFIEPGLTGKLPTVHGSDRLRGLLRPALAKEWGLPETVQIGAGSASPLLAALAAGCVEKGSVAVELGANGMIMAVNDKPVIDFRGEITPLCSATGSWLGLATMQNATAAPEMLRHHYGWSTGKYEEAVASIAPGADGLLVLPYLSGETIPRLPEGTGVIHGLNTSNFTPAHIARATAEGTAFALGYAMKCLRKLGFDPPEVRLLGPGISSKVTRQMLADAFGIPVAPVSHQQGGAMGAAVQAAVGFFQECGEPLGFEEIANYLVSCDDEARCEPNEKTAKLYDELMSRQESLVDTLHSSGFL